LTFPVEVGLQAVQIRQLVEVIVCRVDDLRGLRVATIITKKTSAVQIGCVRLVPLDIFQGRVWIELVVGQVRSHIVAGDAIINGVGYGMSLSNQEENFWKKRKLA
jgi:hypothetical protein